MMTSPRKLLMHLGRPEWYLAFPALLLVILPFRSTVALRLLLLTATAVVAAWAWKRFDVPAVPCKVAIGAWALVAIASVPGAADVAYSLGEVKAEVVYGLVTYVSMFVLARDDRTLRLFLLSLGAGLLLIWAAASLTYAVMGHWPLGAWYGESPLTSNYVLMAVPGALLGIYALSARAFRASLPIAAVLLAVLVVLTGQRATWFAIGVQLLVLGACWLRGVNGTPPPRRKAALTALAVVVAMLTGLGVTEHVRTTSEPIAALERDQRVEVWGNVIHRIAEHPFVGAGYGREVLKRAYPELTPSNNPLFWHAHNIVLNHGLSAGIPGMLAIVGLFLALGARFWSLCASGDRMVRAIGICGAVIVVGVFGRNMFNDFFVRDGALLFWALVGSLLGCALRRQPTP